MLKIQERGCAGGPPWTPWWWTSSVAEEYQVWQTRPCGNGGNETSRLFWFVLLLLSICGPAILLLSWWIYSNSHGIWCFRHLLPTNWLRLLKTVAPVITLWTSTTLRFLEPCHIPITYSAWIGIGNLYLPKGSFLANLGLVEYYALTGEHLPVLCGSLFVCHRPSKVWVTSAPG